ncbi:MAG TPA: thioredoxin [Caldilineae bacterium]|nr:thioredoxin [Caldilineae bacterium]
MPFDAPIHTNAHSIDRVLNAGLPVVLVFWRNNCTPCRQFDPTVNTLARQYAGKLLFAKVDADSEPDLVKRFEITHLPGLAFIRDGSVQATTHGNLSEADLRRWCDYLTMGGPRPARANGPSIALHPDGASRPTAAPGPAPTARPPRGSGKPITLTDANFAQVINGDLPVLVDFWAPWCGPCHMVAPTVEALAQEYAGKLVVGKLNVDENQRTAGRYGVMSIPTLLIFRNGKVVDQIVGAQPAHVLRQRVFPHVRG